MINCTDLTGLAGVASAAATLLLAGIKRPSTTLRTGLPASRHAVLLGIILLLMLIPFGGLPLAAYVRGLTGDLSITTLVLLWCALSRPWLGAETNADKGRRALLLLIAAAALLFYPLALGLTAYDPYHHGYGDPWLVATLLLVALTAWMWKYHLIALCIALSILAWPVGWYESDNLWDYLMDPWVAIYALIFNIKRGVKLFRPGRSQSGSRQSVGTG